MPICLWCWRGAEPLPTNPNLSVSHVFPDSGEGPRPSPQTRNLSVSGSVTTPTSISTRSPPFTLPLQHNSKGIKRDCESKPPSPTYPHFTSVKEPGACARGAVAGTPGVGGGMRGVTASPAAPRGQFKLHGTCIVAPQLSTEWYINLCYIFVLF